MAKYRNVSVKFWSDDFVTENLTPESRYFFLYLLTNEHTAQCGIYEITRRQMAFETGYNAETVERLLQFFEAQGKIKWSKETNEIAIKNFIRYNPQGSPKVKSYVTKEMAAIKNQSLVDFIYGGEKSETSNSGQLYPIDPLSQREEEREEEEERELEKELETKVKQTILERKEKLRLSLVPFVGTYTKDLIRNFFDYWTETNASQKKMRFEDEKFFDLKKRLATWSKNEKKSFNKTAVPVTKIESPFKKREIHA
jgi:hypothetical protein